MTEEQIQKLLKQHQIGGVVAWRFWSEDWQYVCDHRMLHRLSDDVLIEPLFLAPNKWQGLTDDDVKEITKNVIAFKTDVVKFIRETEAKLKEKNT